MKKCEDSQVHEIIKKKRCIFNDFRDLRRFLIFFNDFNDLKKLWRFVNSGHFGTVFALDNFLNDFKHLQRTWHLFTASYIDDVEVVEIIKGQLLND